MNPKANRLAAEKSPYLLQHAHNPVEWLPWGPEAFETARRLDRPIFLSIGYSTCHWCHVMERECFEDEEVAALLNRTVVSVKVDREERPDIDHVYMTFCQAMTGRGGWPLTAILTPEGKPFFAGTYFPKGGSPDRPGLMDIIARLGQLWAANRADLLENAEDLTRRLAEFMEPRPRSGHGDDRRDVGPALLAEAASDLARQYDRERGGFGQAPKFPSAHLPIFLLRQAARANRPKYRRMALKTLAAMRLGGLYDHLGFGFHRYSTDADWLLPHFEKMLYDQAMLALAYAEAWQVSRGPLFRQTTLEILDFLAREMTSPEGAFYSALDADSEGEEGRFYVLTEDEVRAALPPKEAELFLATYNFRPEGNFRDEATGRATGANIPYLAAPPGSDLEARLAPIRQTLLSWREKRPRPHRDDKILTDLNGLAIAAMARAGRIFKRPDLVARAAGAADFILDTLRDERGNLLHRYRDGQAAIPGLLADHAFLALGLLELLAAESRPLRLRQALTLSQALVERFEDPDKGGFFLTANEAEKLLFRPKDFTDAAIPSGNSVAVLVLGRLSRLTGRRDVETAAKRAVAAAMPQLGEHPSGHAFLLTGLDALLDPPPDVVVSGDPGDPEAMALLEAAAAALPPEGSLLARGPDTAAELAELAPRTRDMALPGGRAAAFVCAGRTCLPPLTDPAALAAAIGS